MKKICTAVILVILFVTLVQAQDDVMKKVYQLYRDKEYTEALKMVDNLIQDEGETDRLLEAKYYIFKATDQDDKAKEVAKKRLVLVDKQIEEKGEDARTLSIKFGLLKELGRTDEALKAAIQGDELAEKKRPWGCLDIAKIYLEKKDTKNTLDWLEKAVERGYISYQGFMEEDYRALHDNKRFKKLIHAMKDSIGIDKPAKDFTLDLLSGGTFTLSEQKGKVVVIDFWASWCGPCLAEMPNVKKIYSKYKDQGFEIIGISLDNKKEDLESYLKEAELGWKFSYSGKGWQDETAGEWGVNSIPSMWLVDKKGTLRHFGLREEALAKAVAELMAE